ncbi:MAG: glycosyltransferase family 2 protein [Coriobacteriales bacterium]|nr:glycosyltransferase family 2 protein [Coriobacteriales bacterium]
MAQQPLISIIVPVYNAAGLLDRCLDSIEKLACTDFEVLLVDDGSTDESPALCDNRARRDGRFRVIHQDNQGAAGARNRGIEEASGRYLLFVDCDDEVDPQLASELASKVEEGPYDLVICGYDRINELDEVISRRDVDPQLHGGMEELALYLVSDMLFPSPWAKLFSRKVFSEVRFTKGHQFEDALIWADIIRTVDELRFATVGKRLYRYRITSTGLMSTYHEEQEQDLVDAWTQVCDAYQERFGDSAADEVAFRRAGVWFDVIDRAILHDRSLDAPLCQTALQELRAHRGEVFASPYRTRRRKLMFCLLLHAPKLYQAIVRRYGQRA